MKIFVDGSSLNEKMSGTKRNLYYILDILIATENLVTILVKKEIYLNDYPNKSKANLRIIIIKFLPPLVCFFLFIPLYLRKHNYRFYWSNNHRVPFFLPSKTKVLFTIHDFTFYLFPWTMKFSSRFLHYCMFKRSVKRADYLLFHSQSVIDTFSNFFPNSKKINLKILPLNQLKRPRTISENQNFFLAVGTIEPRKNIGALVRAFAQLKATRPSNVSLVIAGSLGWHYQNEAKLIEEAKKHGVIFIKNPSDIELDILFHECRALIFPSLYEGLGLPVLEAISSGKPVCCSEISSFNEILGTAGVYFDPRNINDISEKMNFFLDDEFLEKAINFTSRRYAKICEIAAKDAEILNDMLKKIITAD